MTHTARHARSQWLSPRNTLIETWLSELFITTILVNSRPFFKQNVTTIDSITNFLDHIVTIIYYYPINWLIIEQYEILYYYFRKKGTILFYLENFNFSIARWNDSIVRKIEWNQFWKERGKKELFYFFLITFLCKIIYMCVCLIYEMRFQK